MDTLRVTSPDPVLESWRWTAFDRGSGLAGGVRDIFEDRDGNVWFATDNGAQRYDGLRWTTYTTKDGLAHNQVRTVMQTRDGAIWFGTSDGGISRFDGKTWKTYTTADGLASNSMHWRGLLQARDGTLWAGCISPGGLSDTTGTRGGISRFDPSTPLRAGGKTWTTINVPGGPPRPNIDDIHEARDGSIWFTTMVFGGAVTATTSGHGVLRFQNGRWTRYTAADGLEGNTILELLESRDGSIWVASWDKGINRFDPSTGSGQSGRRWRTYTARDGLPEKVQFCSIWQAADGTLWAGGGSGRLCRLDPSAGSGRGGERWYAYAPEEVPQLSGYVLSQTTRNGMVWFCGWGEARASRFDPQGIWTVYTHPDSLFGGFETADGSVWFHTRRAAVRYREGLWMAYTPTDGFMDGEVLRLCQTSNGSLWFIGTHLGMSAVARRDRTGWRIYTEKDGLIDGIFGTAPVRYFGSSFLETRDGSIWLGGQYKGRAAISRFNGQGWTRYTEKDGLGGEWVTECYEATDGTLWFGLRMSGNSGYGLFRFDGKTWTHYTEKDGLSSSHITGIAEWPAGTLWVGTERGIGRFDLSAPEKGWWNKVDFPVNNPKVRSFLPTEDALWFGFLPPRRAGVVRHDGKTWRIYTETDGLADDSVSSIIRASDGALWFVTGRGVSRYDGEGWTRYTEGYSPLSGLMYPTMREMHKGDFWINRTDGKVLHFRYRSGQAVPETFLESASDRVSSAGNILLRWSGRDLWDDTPPREMHYQWRMDSGAWSSWSDRSDQTFTELTSGKHAFEVRAVDRDGNVDSTPAVHAFVVEAPWWKNPYVLGLTAVLLGLTGVQTGRVVRRDRRLREANTALSAGNKELFSVNRELQGKTEALEKANQEVRQALTEKEQAQEMLVRSESMAAIGTLVAGVAHELNNPLGAASSLVQSVQEMIQEDSIEEFQQDREAILGHLAFSRKEMGRIKEIVASLLDLSRQTNDYSEPVKLDVVAKDALRVLYNKYKRYEVNVEEEYQEGLPQIPGNFAQLGQVCLNIIQNAIDAVGEKEGKIVLRTYGEQALTPRPPLPYTGEGEYRAVIFECSDTGPGMPDEVRRDIFKPFFTTKAPGKGTGLGLYICHQIVEKHGGTIEVDSAVGKGTTFRVKLPIAKTGD